MVPLQRLCLVAGLFLAALGVVLAATTVESRTVWAVGVSLPQMPDDEDE